MQEEEATSLQDVALRFVMALAPSDDSDVSLWMVQKPYSSAPGAFGHHPAIQQRQSR